MSKEGDIIAAVHNLLVEIINAKNENPLLKPWIEEVLKRWDEDRGWDHFGNYTRKEGQFSKSDLEVAFNRWMDHYTKDPEGFSDGYADALLHLNQKLNGEHPTYGQECAELIERYLEQGE